MSQSLQHPELEAAADNNTVTFVLMLFYCIVTMAVLSFSTHLVNLPQPSSAHVFLIQAMLSLALHLCHIGVSDGRRNAVTLSIVLCALILAPFALVVFAIIWQLLFTANSMGALDFVCGFVLVLVPAAMIVVNISNLYRCYAVIRMFNVGHQRGFDPILPPAPSYPPGQPPTPD